MAIKNAAKKAAFFLIFSSDFKNHSQKRRKKFRAVHNNDFHKNKHLRQREKHFEIPPATRKRSIRTRKSGRNFTKIPRKKPAAKKKNGF